ncbi:MAG: hypothetical protein HYR48_04615 [Gemmatimonadetes bacterium]|nr:hypothetical protein [Gemmatimonadota bacterium]
MRARLSSVLVLLLTLASAPALAQAMPACAQPAIRTKAELIAALRDLRREGRVANPDIESAFIASLGQPVVGWALEIATDTALEVRTDPQVRFAAFMVLRYARWRAAVPPITRLAQPFARPWVEWQGALHALSTYPYPELVPFWRELLHFPRRVVRETALRGLSLTSDADDIRDIREAFHREDDAWSRHIVGRAESLLVQPVAVRDTIWFVWPPDPAGRFVPSGSWLRMGMEFARAAGRCASQ